MSRHRRLQAHSHRPQPPADIPPRSAQPTLTKFSVRMNLTTSSTWLDSNQDNSHEILQTRRSSAFLDRIAQKQGPQALCLPRRTGAPTHPRTNLTKGGETCPPMRVKGNAREQKLLPFSPCNSECLPWGLLLEQGGMNGMNLNRQDAKCAKGIPKRLTSFALSPAQFDFPFL
jgi:hypothetical protein